MRTFVLYLLLSISATGQSSSIKVILEEERRNEPPGSVSGTLLDAVTNAPIAGARIALLIQGQSGTDQSTTTQEDGSFQFTKVVPGQYFLQPSHNDYPGPLGGPQFGVTLNVQPAKATTGISLSLVPLGTVSGRVLNDEGEPVRGCTILLLPTGPPGRGLRPPLLGSSNDKGQFRIVAVPPDRYHAFVRCSEVLPTEHLLDIVPPTGFETKSTWLPVYYPTSPTRAGGQEFPVAPGLDPNLEFRLQATTVSTLKGSFSTVPGVLWRNQPFIQLREVGDEREDLLSAFLAKIDTTRNTFSFQSVPPGNFQLIATVQDGPSTPPGGATTPVSVGITGSAPISIVLQTGVPLRGVVEEPPGRRPIRASYTTITEQTPDGTVTRTEKQPLGRIYLESLGSGRNLTAPPAVVEADSGSFGFPSVAPGRWRVLYNSHAGKDYVESLLFNDKRVDGNEIEIAPASTPTLRLRLCARPQVTFELEGVPAGPKSIWMVVGVAEREPVTELDEYLADGKPGQIGTISLLPPGRYRLLAMELGLATTREYSLQRLLRVLVREVDPVEITADSGQSIPVRCFSTDRVRKILQTYLYGDTPPPSAP